MTILDYKQKSFVLCETEHHIKTEEPLYEGQQNYIVKKHIISRDIFHCVTCILIIVILLEEFNVLLKKTFNVRIASNFRIAQSLGIYSSRYCWEQFDFANFIIQILGVLEDVELSSKHKAEEAESSDVRHKHEWNSNKIMHISGLPQK